MEMSPIIQSFVLHFGEMGSKWGINRTVGQIYAFLYLSEKPQNAEDICNALNFSRSNVSMGLKELEGWQLIKTKHLPNDRRDYFTTPEDAWEILRTLIEQKRQRELEPTLSLLRDELLEQTSCKKDKYAQQKMQEMHDMLDMFTNWYMEMRKMDNESLKNLMSLGKKVYKLYELKNNLPIMNKTKNKERA